MIALIIMIINETELPSHDLFYSKMKNKILAMKNIIFVSMLGMITP
jgi:hypothetical protein